jgi:RNA recognition motif-containing protein
VTRGYAGGKRQREAERDRKKKEKMERLRQNRAMRSQGMDPGPDEPGLGEDGKLPEIKLEDIVISVAPRPKRGTVGPVKLFVGGLSWDTTTEDLTTAFAKFGTVLDATVILDRTTGRSRGFGFVTFDKPPDAMEAVKQMNGAELDGRILKVNLAESR